MLPEEPEQVDDTEADDSLVAEFLLFLKEEKRWWLSPMVVALVLISGFLVFAEASAFAPFLYPFF